MAYTSPFDIPDDDPEFQAFKTQFLGTGKKQNSGLAGDLGTGLKIGVEQLPGVATGLADTVLAPISKMTGVNRPVSRAADWLGEQTGFQPSEWAKQAEDEYSPQYQAAKQDVQDTKGFLPTVGALARNPRFIAGTVAESLPSMVAGMGVGGVAARGVVGAEKIAALRTAAAAGDKAALAQLGSAGALAGFAGEGVVTAGQHMSQTDYDTDPLLAAGTAIASGVGTGLIGAMGGRLAAKMGVSDIDTLAVTGLANRGATASVKDVAKNVGKGAFTEGVLEELPQSMQEQIWQNVASGKPWNEGVAEQGAIGMMAGAAMGAGANVMPRRAPKPEDKPVVDEKEPEDKPVVDEKEPVSLLGHNPEIGTSWNNTYNYNPIIAEASEAQVPLEQLDMLNLGRNMTEAREMMNADLSQRRQDALYDMPEFNLNDQELPLPTDPGSAVAVIQVLSNAAEQGQAIPEGSPAHKALVEAQRILSISGLSYIASRAPVIAKGKTNATTQVAQESGQGASGVAGGSTGNTQDQPGVGRGGNELAATPVLGSGTDQSVGDTRVGNGAGVNVTEPAQVVAQAQKANDAKAGTKSGTALVAQGVKPGTKGALEAAVTELMPEESTERQDHINAIQTAKSYTAARKALAKMSPQGLKIALRSAPQEEQRVVQTALGWDAQGNQVGSRIASYADVAKAAGLNSRQRVQQILKSYGIDSDVINRMNAADQQAVSVSELMPSQQEDGGAQDGTGFRIMDNPNASDDIVDDRKTRIETHLANKFAAEQGVTAKDLAQGVETDDTVQTAEEVAREERKAAAAQTEAEKYFDEVLNDPEAEIALADFEAIFEGRSRTDLTKAEQAEFVIGYKQALMDYATFDEAEAALKKEFDTYGQVGRTDEGAGVQQPARVAGRPQLAEVRGESGQAEGSETTTRPEQTGSAEGSADGVKQSRGVEGSTQASAIESKLKPLFFSNSRFSSRVVVVQSATALPQNLQSAIDGNTQAFVQGGKVYMIADNIAEGKELAVFLHEVGVHLGMKGLIGQENLNRLAMQIKRWATNNDGSVESELAKKALARVKSAQQGGVNMELGDVIEERVAYFVEEAVNAGINPTALDKASGPLQRWFGAFMKALHNALTKFGLRSVESLSAQNIVDLAYGAANIQLGENAAEQPSSIKFSKTAQAIKQYGGESGVQAWEDASGVASRAFKWLMSLHDLVGKYGDVLPSAKGWYDSVRATAAARNRIKEDAESIAARAGKLNKVVLKQLNEFISKSTYEQKWGYDATFDKLDGTKRDVKADPEMAKLFRALPKDAQEIAKAVFAHGEKMKIEKFKIMKQLGLDKDTFLEQGSLTGPYAPLKRFGDYVAILKSKELRAAEQAGDTKKVEELKANPDHYVVSNFDTLGQAKKFARANEATFGWSDAFKGSVNVEVGHRMKPETLQKVLAAVKAEDLPSNVKGQVETMVREMYLSAFDEHNARMSGLKRKNRAGYDADMIRSFLAHARAEAGFLSNMQHGGKTNELFYKLQQEAKNDDGKRTGQDVFNAIAQHYAANLDHKDTPIQDRVLAFTSIMQLATNPAYHIQNYMQPLMVSLPRLAADFNDYGGAWNALRQGYAISREMVKGNIFKLETEIDLSVVKNTKLREMLQTAADAGLLDVGMDEDLANFESTRTGYELVDNASNGMKKVVHKLRQMSRRVEATNRISAAVAAYNMSYGRNKDHAKATEYAISVLQDTQGDFSKTDAPLIIKRLPKFMVQYRKFQLMMAAHYVKAFNDAFRSEDAETRAVGRRTLLISLGHALASAGVMGLPLMNVVGLIFKATGSDDEPRDLERTLREMFGDNANYLLRGPFWFMGLDAKLSQDKVFSILPYADWDLTSRKGGTNLLVGLTGPSGSNGLRMLEGFGKMAEGDYYKGLAGILPSGLANGVKAFQVANKGYTLKNGDVMVKPEDIETFQLLLDSIGMKSPEMRRMDWYKNQQWEVKQFYSDRSKEIQREYAEAFKGKDTAQLAELRQDWMDLQAGKDHLRYLFGDNHDELKRQPLSNLIKYPQTVANRERKLQRSVAE